LILHVKPFGVEDAGRSRPSGADAMHFARLKNHDYRGEQRTEGQTIGNQFPAPVSQKIQGRILRKQGEVPVERIEAEVMLPGMLRDEQIRNAHFVHAVPQTNRL